MSAAAEHAHCNTTIHTAQLLNERLDMMATVKILDRWEDGKLTPVPDDARVMAHRGGGVSDPFFATVYVDDYLLMAVQHSDDDATALTASASLASDHVRLFGPGETGVTPTLAPKKSTDWNTTIDALGFTTNSHTTRISLTREKIEAIANLLHDQWPSRRRSARARDVLSIAGKLWNLTYVVRAGRYFVWRLSRLTGLHDERHPRNQNVVPLGSEFHADLSFWKWAISQKLLQPGEAVFAPCYTAVRRPAKRHYLSDASFEAMGGYCIEHRIYWRYDLPPELTQELKEKAERRETCTITINLLERLGMVVTAWRMLEMRGDAPEAVEDPIAMRGDNVAAVTRINRCGGARDKRACLLMRMLGRLKIKGEWSHDAKLMPGVQNTLTDGISRWSRTEIAEWIRDVTNSHAWAEQPIGPRRNEIFGIVLQTKNLQTRHDDSLWRIMANAGDNA